MRTSMQTTKSTSVRRSAEAHEGIALGYARFGALLTAVLSRACACVLALVLVCVCMCVWGGVMDCLAVDVGKILL
jgi:hypothetical protein